MIINPVILLPKHVILLRDPETIPGLVGERRTINTTQSITGYIQIQGLDKIM